MTIASVKLPLLEPLRVPACTQVLYVGFNDMDELELHYLTDNQGQDRTFEAFLVGETDAPIIRYVGSALRNTQFYDSRRFQVWHVFQIQPT